MPPFAPELVDGVDGAESSLDALLAGGLPNSGLPSGSPTELAQPAAPSAPTTSKRPLERSHSNGINEELRMLFFKGSLTSGKAAEEWGRASLGSRPRRCGVLCLVPAGSPSRQPLV